MWIHGVLTWRLVLAWAVSWVCFPFHYPPPCQRLEMPIPVAIPVTFSPLPPYRPGPLCPGPAGHCCDMCALHIRTAGLLQEPMNDMVDVVMLRTRPRPTRAPEVSEPSRAVAKPSCAPEVAKPPCLPPPAQPAGIREVLDLLESSSRLPPPSMAPRKPRTHASRMLPASEKESPETHIPVCSVENLGVLSCEASRGHCLLVISFTGRCPWSAFSDMGPCFGTSAM